MNMNISQVELLAAICECIEGQNPCAQLSDDQVEGIILHVRGIKKLLNEEKVLDFPEIQVA